MSCNLSFDEILELIDRDHKLFENKVRTDPSILDVKWMGSETLIQFLITERKYEQVSLLASLGADVNARKNNGGTALHAAILSNDIEGVKLMVRLGADVSIVSHSGFLPLEWAEFLDVEKPIIDFLKSCHGRLKTSKTMPGI